MVWAVAAFAFIFLLFSLPVDIKLSTQNEELFKGKISWMFGLISMELKKELKSGKKEGSKRSKKKMLNLKLFKIMMKFIRPLLKSIKWKKGHLTVILGFDNPADTGLIMGYWLSLAETFQLPDSIQLVPSFQQERLEWDGCGELRIIPAEFIYISLSCLFSPFLRRTTSVS